MVQAMPYVHLYAKERGIDITQVPANKDGIITKENVDSVFTRSIEPTEIDLGLIDQYNPGYHSQREEDESYREETYIRKFNSSTMEMSHRIIPSFSIFEEVDATNLIGFQSELSENSGEEKAWNFSPYIIKALVTAAKRYPTLNASLDDTLARFVFKNYYNIGFEVNTVQGLFKPVIKDADQKSIMEIEKEMKELTAEINQRKFSYEKLSGGTLTISDISEIGKGAGHFTPLIHYPDVANLGIGKVQEKPVAENGKVIVKPMLPLSLVIDYRVVDRVDAVNIVNFLKELLESPVSLLYKS